MLPYEGTGNLKQVMRFGRQEQVKVHPVIQVRESG